MFKDQKQDFILQSSFIFICLHEKGQPGLFHLPANSEKGKQKVQEERQAGVAANPWHQEEEKKWHRLACP